MLDCLSYSKDNQRVRASVVRGERRIHPPLCAITIFGCTSLGTDSYNLKGSISTTAEIAVGMDY